MIPARYSLSYSYVSISTLIPMPMSYADSYMPYSDPVCLRGEAFTTLGS